MSRQNKANRKSQIQDVAIRSVLRPFKADNILNFMIRYQASSGATDRNVTRGNILNVLIMNVNSGTSNYRLCAAVRVNRINITTSIGAALEWLSEYGPTSATIVSATSTTAAGELNQRPPKNSLCSMWCLNGSNESTNLFRLTTALNDYIDVHYSVVLLDVEPAVSVTTQTGGTTGQVYRSYLDGPSVSAKFGPVYINALF